MSSTDVIVLGSEGLIGSAVSRTLESNGLTVTRVHRGSYIAHKGLEAAVLINCNGNSLRFRANQDPHWDFQASVASVEASLFDFKVARYVYLSTVDVYNRVDSLQTTTESTTIVPKDLMPYAFHKWLAERIVERHAPKSLILRLSTVIGPDLKKGPLFDLVNDKPLFMSLDSEISFVDTHTIAAALVALLIAPEASGIFNVAPTGASRLANVAKRIQKAPMLAPEASGTLYHYAIANQKISGYIPMPTSDHVVQRFLESQGVRVE